MVMMEIVNAVTPLRRPAVTEKRCFKMRSCVLSGHVNDIAIQQNRQVFVVRNPPVSRQPKNFRSLRGCAPGISETHRAKMDCRKYGMEVSASDSAHNITD